MVVGMTADETDHGVSPHLMTPVSRDALANHPRGTSMGDELRVAMTRTTDAAIAYHQATDDTRAACSTERREARRDLRALIARV